MESLGICLDGKELKLVHLRKTNGTVELLNHEKVLLQGEPGVVVQQDDQQDDEAGFDDVFTGVDAEAATATATADDQATLSDSNILFNTLAKYPQQKLNIGVNLLESEVSFIDIFSGSTDQKKKNLHKKLKEELQKISSNITNENFDYIVKNDQEYTTFYHNNELSLLHKVLEVKNSTKSKARISLVDVNEISLLNLYTKLVGEGASILVYVGNLYSRIMFLEDKRLIRISQLINEGCYSRNLKSSLFAKVLFELDTLEVGDIQSIYLTGSGELSELETFFKEKLPEGEVKFFPFSNILTLNENVKEEDLNSFAVPISLALKILAEKDSDYVETNFLPADIKKQQGEFQFAWHGHLLLAVFVLTTLFFAWQWKQFSARKKDAQSSIVNVDDALVIQNSIQNKMIEMSVEGTKYINIFTLIDSIGRNSTMNSDVLRYLSLSVRKLNSIWIDELNLSEDNFNITGRSIWRQRIHRLADTTGVSSVIETMDEEVIRERILYKYKIDGNPWEFVEKRIVFDQLDSLINPDKTGGK